MLSFTRRSAFEQMSPWKMITHPPGVATNLPMNRFEAAGLIVRRADGQASGRPLLASKAVLRGRRQPLRPPASRSARLALRLGDKLHVGAPSRREPPSVLNVQDYTARLRQLVEQCRRAARNSFEVEAKGAFRTIGEELSNMADELEPLGEWKIAAIDQPERAAFSAPIERSDEGRGRP
jgi:hypothetical protein